MILIIKVMMMMMKMVMMKIKMMNIFFIIFRIMIRMMIRIMIRFMIRVMIWRMIRMIIKIKIVIIDDGCTQYDSSPAHLICTNGSLCRGLLLPTGMIPWLDRKGWGPPPNTGVRRGSLPSSPLPMIGVRSSSVSSCPSPRPMGGVRRGCLPSSPSPLPMGLCTPVQGREVTEAPKWVS